MQFDRKLLKDWVEMQMASSDADSRCIGHNFLIEENVSDGRRLELEAHDPESTDAKELLDSYYEIYVQGTMSGHVPSTFKMPMNFPALQSVAVNPARVLVRLERLDAHLLPVHRGIGYDELTHALHGGDPDPILRLLQRIRNIPGERPVFSGYMSDIRRILRRKDWLPYIVDFFGLYHQYPFDPQRPNCFALFEYTAAEVIEQAGRNGIEHCFALPTVLESWSNPAFFPVPRMTGQGRVVNLRGNGLVRPAREILHPRFDYSARHLTRLGVWPGAEKPDIDTVRRLHSDLLRRETGRPDFGKIGKMP